MARHRPRRLAHQPRRSRFAAGVEAIRRHRSGDVYQVNLARRLSAPLPPDAEVGALAAALAAGNPAPYAAAVHLPRHGVHVASASPELFLGRDGDLVWSSPIQGTGDTCSPRTGRRM